VSSGLDQHTTLYETTNFNAALFPLIWYKMDCDFEGRIKWMKFLVSLRKWLTEDIQTVP